MKEARFPRALVALLLAGGSAAALAQNYTLEGAVIDSRTSRNLGIVSERGDINSLFRAQKAMTYGILRSAGIPVESLPPEVRARVERFATNNLEAFRAFSQGLDLKDQGRYAEAKEAFRRAAELDPGFLLAVEQQRAMPDVNVGTGLQARAVLAAASNTAVERGKAAVAVDTARAVAALASGQQLVLLPATAANEPPNEAGYAVNKLRQGSVGAGTEGTRLVVGLSAGLTFSDGSTGSIVTAQEWRGDAYVVSEGRLDSLGNPSLSFLAQRRNATAEAVRSVDLADGGKAYWGAWISTPAASARIVTANAGELVAPALGQRVDYVLANATRVMPTSGTVTYTPSVAGSFTGATGGIEVNFVSRMVTLQGLGFTISDKTFTGLNGTASYDPARSAAGTFRGFYAPGGACPACTGFVSEANSFGGSFVGRGAAGLIFSTTMNTGINTSSSGVHLYTPPPPGP